LAVSLKRLPACDANEVPVLAFSRKRITGEKKCLWKTKKKPTVRSISHIQETL
jgi:hypothetical protein